MSKKGYKQTIKHRRKLSLSHSMDYKEIGKLPVKEIADEKCILFLWATFPQLKEALTVIEAWGFEYKTLGFLWIKTNPNQAFSESFGIGYYTKSNAEICLLATKGKAHSLVKNNSISQVVPHPKTRHSEKPAIIRKKIVKLVGDIPRIELFARQKIEGWDAIGDEIDGQDIRKTLENMIK